MGKNKFSEKQIRVGGTTGVEPISIKYKDSDYTLSMNSDKKALKDKNGYLVIAELFSSDKKLQILIFLLVRKTGKIYGRKKDMRDIGQNLVMIKIENIQF